MLTKLFISSLRLRLTVNKVELVLIHAFCDLVASRVQNEDAKRFIEGYARGCDAGSEIMRTVLSDLNAGVPMHKTMLDASIKIVADSLKMDKEEVKTFLCEVLHRQVDDLLCTN